MNRRELPSIPLMRRLAIAIVVTVSTGNAMAQPTSPPAVQLDHPDVLVDVAVGPSAIAVFLGPTSDSGLAIDSVYTFELRAGYYVTPTVALVGGVGAWIEVPFWGTSRKQRDAQHYETVLDARIRKTMGGRFWGAAGLAVLFEHQYRARRHVGWVAQLGCDVLQRERGGLAIAFDWLAAPTDEGAAGGVFGIVRLGLSVIGRFDLAL